MSIKISKYLQHIITNKSKSPKWTDSSQCWSSRWLWIQQASRYCVKTKMLGSTTLSCFTQYNTLWYLRYLVNTCHLCVSKAQFLVIISIAALHEYEETLWIFLISIYTRIKLYRPRWLWTICIAQTGIDLITLLMQYSVCWAVLIDNDLLLFRWSRQEVIALDHHPAYL